jgi:uncharacterized protein YggE
MKKNLLFIVGLALVAIVAGVTACTATPAPTSVSSPESLSNTGIILSQQNTGIRVTGEGTVTVVPDVAILNLGVEAQATTVAQAQQEAAEDMEAVVKELDERGVAKKDIKTQRFSIYPVKRWENEREILIGYRVNNMVTAKIRNVDDTGTIIDAVARVGGDYIRINGISFTLDDPTAYHEEARKKAMDDAKTKAEQLASLADVKLGKPIFISESGGFIPVPRDVFLRAEGAPAPAPTTSISPGETDVRLSVQVVYSIG